MVLETSQSLPRAHVLVQAPLSVTSGHAVLGPAQDDPLLAAADLACSHIHFQLCGERDEGSQ